MKKTGRRQRRFNKKTLKRKYIKRQSGGNQGKMMAQTALRAMKTASRTALQNARKVAQGQKSELTKITTELMEGKSVSDINYTGLRNWAKQDSKPFKEILLKKLLVSVPKTGVKMFGKKMLNFVFGISDAERAKALSDPDSYNKRVFTSEDLQELASDFDKNSKRLSSAEINNLNNFDEYYTPDQLDFILELDRSKGMLTDIANEQEQLYNAEQSIIDENEEESSVDKDIFGYNTNYDPNVYGYGYGQAGYDVNEVDGGRKRKQKTRRRKHKKSFW